MFESMLSPCTALLSLCLFITWKKMKFYERLLIPIKKRKKHSHWRKRNPNFVSINKLSDTYYKVNYELCKGDIYSIIVDNMNNINIDMKYESQKQKRDMFILYANFIDTNDNIIEPATHLAKTFGELYKNDLSYLESIPFNVKEKKE